MPIIPHTPEELAARERRFPEGGTGFPLQTIIGDPRLVAPPEERTTATFDLGSMSQKEQRRGGDYSALGLGVPGALAQDITGGLLKGLALIPDTILNLALRDAERDLGLEKGTFSRDNLKRLLVSGDYEEAEPMVGGLLKFGKGEELGTGSKVGDIASATAEFAILAHPFAKAIGAMAKASKASQAAAAGTTTFRSTQAAGPGGVRMAVPASPVDPLTGRAVGVGFAPTTLTGKAKEAILAPYRRDPKSATRVEMLFGGLSGLGLGIDQQVFGGSGIKGALIGPLAPMVLGSIFKIAPTRWIANKAMALTGGVADDMAFARTMHQGKAVDDLLNSTDPKLVEAKQLLARELQKIAGTPTAEAELARSRLIQEQFGHLFDEFDEVGKIVKEGTVPLSVAAMLNDPILIQKTQIAIAQGGADAYRAELAIVDDMLEKIKTQIYKDYEIGLTSAAGGTTTRPNYIINELTDEYDSLASSSLTHENQLQTQLDAIAGTRLSQSERVAAGTTVREQLDAAKRTAINRMEAEANRIGINSSDQVAAVDDLRQFGIFVTDIMTPGQGKESLTWKTIINPLIKEFTLHAQTGKLSLQDWKAFREKIGINIGHAARDGAHIEANQLRLFNDMLDDFVSGSAKAKKNRLAPPELQQFGVPSSPALSGKYQYGGASGEDILKYIDDYKREVIEPFSNNYIAQSNARIGGTKDVPVYQTRAENIAGSYLTPEGIDSYIRVFGNNTERMNDARNAMRDRALGQAYDGKGNLKLPKLKTFITDNDDVLRKLNLFDELSDNVTAYDTLSQRLTKQTELSEGIANNKLKLMLNRFSGDNADLLFPKLFQNTEAMREASGMIAQANNPALTKAFNANVVDEALKRVYKDVSTDITTDPSKFLMWINNGRNRANLISGIGEEATDRLQLLADFADRANSVLKKSSGKGTGFINVGQLAGADATTIIDAIKNATGTSIPAATARFIAVQEGRIGGRTALVYFLVRALNTGSTARYDAVMAEALRNPSFAKQLLKQAPTEMLPNNQTGLPLAGPRNVLGDFLFRRAMGGGYAAGMSQLETKAEETDLNLGAVSQPILPPRTPDSDFQFINPTDPPVNPRPLTVPPTSGFAGGPPMPSPPIGIAGVASQQPVEEEVTETTSFSELFPFDATGQAIANRRKQEGGGGLGSLV